MQPDVRVHPQADVAEDASLGARTAVWAYAQVGAGAVIGSDCVIGSRATIGPGVRMGDRCKVQNHALVYQPAVVEDGAFLGPACVLTNDEYPRAVTPDGVLKSGSEWTPVAVVVREGASIGAGAVCVAPVEVGRWAMVAAGAVVTADVPPFALVAGVPARRVGWVGREGVPLEDLGDGRFRCPRTQARYVEFEGVLTEEAST